MPAELSFGVLARRQAPRANGERVLRDEHPAVLGDILQRKEARDSDEEALFAGE